MCLYPTITKNRKYTKTKKNGGVIPSISDLRTEYIPINCGNCIECRKQKAREWQIRLMEDIKTHKHAQFVTLTFSNESIKELVEHTIKKTNKQGIKETIKISELKGYAKDNAIATKAVRLFLERWRKEEKPPRHWLITELGHKGTENIHLHGIIYTDDHNKIKKHWKYGYVWDGYDKNGKRINYVNNKTINYLIKYVSKVDQRNKEYKSKVLTSKGIGANYINTTEARKNEINLKETYRTTTGHKIYLPTYWRKKLFTEDTRERLWIKKLDEGTKYICGEKFNINDNPEHIKETIQWHRKRNHQLGYGGKPNENRKEHEELRRETLIATRIKNASGGV